MYVGFCQQSNMHEIDCITMVISVYVYHITMVMHMQQYHIEKINFGDRNLAILEKPSNSQIKIAVKCTTAMVYKHA